MTIKMKISWSKRFQARLRQFYFINIVAILMSACSASGLPDGSICRKDEDCRSTHCRTYLCSGSKCMFSKSDKQSDCDDGWECMLFQDSDIFFSSSGFSCALPCPTCPERYQCLFQEKNCSPNPDWANPIVTVTPSSVRVTTGESVRLHASAVSPAGEDIEFTYKWSIMSETAMGPDLSRSFDTRASFAAVVEATLRTARCRACACRRHSAPN